MKRRTMLLRVGAIASSVVLVGGYVWYRASAAEATGEAPAGLKQVAAPEKVMPGSKSAPVFPGDSDDEALKQKATERAVMSGSKSAAVVKPKDVPGVTPKAPDTKPQAWQPPQTPPLLSPPAQKPQDPK